MSTDLNSATEKLAAGITDATQGSLEEHERIQKTRQPPRRDGQTLGRDGEGYFPDQRPHPQRRGERLRRTYQKRMTAKKPARAPFGFAYLAVLSLSLASPASVDGQGGIEVGTVFGISRYAHDDGLTTVVAFPDALAREYLEFPRFIFPGFRLKNYRSERNSVLESFKGILGNGNTRNTGILGTSAKTVATSLLFSWDPGSHSTPRAMRCPDSTS